MFKAQRSKEYFYHNHMTGAHPKDADELKPHATKSKLKKNAVFVNKLYQKPDVIYPSSEFRYSNRFIHSALEF